MSKRLPNPLAGATMTTVLPDFKNYRDKNEGRRIVLWIFWTLNMLINLLYICFSFATSHRLIKNISDVNTAFSNTAWRGPIASAVLGALMVLAFNILSCVILIRKSINKSGPGFGYGFIMAWCFVMSFHTLLCGLVMDSFTDTVKNDVESQTLWGGYYTQIYIGTVALAFICAVMFMLFFICLVVFQGGITKSIGLYDINTDEKRKLEMVHYNRTQAGRNGAAHPAAAPAAPGTVSAAVGQSI